MPNHLADQNSPYLLQHADNPVEWYPWGAEALERARREDKPIFLSIGYAACHWCHVMAHESFEDEATAAWMNQHFINIKVDREERPDLDAIYMQAVTALTGQGGWPMSVFLTPDGKPFYGGTYFPPERRYGMPAFQELLQSIAMMWQQDSAALLNNTALIAQHLAENAASMPHGGELDADFLEQAVHVLQQSYDWRHGGWGNAPRFPQPMSIEFLLRRAVRGDQQALETARHALRAMAKGGMYDVVGGGFARYSVDNLWRTPHFEKMLYDNGQLALAYLHAWLVSRADQPQSADDLRRVCERTLDFVLREMTHPAGGFFSSLDADSEDEEGKFYLWTLAEVRAALPDERDAQLFIAAYGITDQGNFEGKTILQRVKSDEELAESFDLQANAVPAELERLHARLLEVRSGRVRPGTDDKVLTFWNALALRAFAEAGRYLNRPDYLEAARRNADFLLNHLHQPGRLLRSWRAGRAQLNAYLEDYASLILALLELYQSDPQVRWYRAALQLTDEMLAHFADPAGGFFDTRDDHEMLIVRPRDVQDNATPSGNALAAAALLKLSSFGDRFDARRTAEQMLAGMQAQAVRYPTAFAQWLCAVDDALRPRVEVAVVGEHNHPGTLALRKALWQTYRPRLTAAFSSEPVADGAPLLFEDRVQVGGLPTAYVCRGFACQAPVHTPQEMLADIENEPPVTIPE